MTNNTKPIIDGKSFFDYPEKEKKEIITEAAIESSKEMQKVMSTQNKNLSSDMSTNDKQLLDEFWLFWGIAPKGTPKYKAGLKAFEFAKRAVQEERAKWEGRGILTDCHGCGKVVHIFPNDVQKCMYQAITDKE